MYVYIFGNASRLYRENFGLITLIILLVWVPLEVLSGYMDAFVFDPDDIRRSFKFYLLLENFIGIIATGAILALADSVTFGKGLNFGGAFGEGLGAWGRLWWTRLLTGLLLVAGLLALIIPGLYLLVRLSAVEPVAVCERISGGAAIQRSFELTKGKFWSLFGLGWVVLGGMALTAVVANAPAIFIPEEVHWTVDVGVAIVLDVLFAYVTLLTYTTYQWLMNQQAAPPSLEFGQNVEPLNES
ncbi:MAG: hypothetical protein ACAI34_25160 [Verrucomicrobium sp.]|nr:hypothetical protein [Verrucomicrobium sp.]